MTSPSNSAVQNLLPVQAYFDAKNNFVTFIGQGLPFYATANPFQSGLTITNSTLDSSPIGSTSPSTGVFTNIATTTGTITSNASSATDIVNLLTLQAYAAGISWKNPVTAATTANITLSGLQTVDTVSLIAGNTVLVKNQTDNTKNGIYTVSSGAWTYATGSTTWAQYVSALVFVEYGTQQGSAWYCAAQPGGTLGTTPMIWSQFSVSTLYSAGTGLTLTGYQFSITNTGVAASTYGSATATPVFAVNAQGQITSVTNTTITPAIGNVTGLGTGIATFLQTPTSANLAAAVTDETGTGALVFNTSPTFITPALGTPASGVLTNATGLPLTTGVTGTLAIGNGGTGQTTASAAFNALSPITSVGDLIIGNGTNSATRLGIGANNTALTSNGTTAAWTAISSFMVYPGAGIPNSTGSAWGTSYSTTGSGTVVALATSPVFVTPTLGAASATSINTSGTETASAFVANKTITGALSAGAFSYGTLAYTDIDIFGSYTISANAYAQKILQNTNSGASASVDFVISNNLGTATTYYGDFGITSSGYNSAGTNITNTPNTVYLQAVTTGLAIGTLNANTTTFYANSTQSAQIGTAGAWSFVNDATINGLTVGKGGGSAANNVVVGNGALAATNTGGNTTAVGASALAANTSGDYGIAFGAQTLTANTTGTSNSGLGQGALYTNTTGGYNTAVGRSALFSNTTASNNTAVGFQVLYSNTTGANNIGIGSPIAGFANSTLYANTTGTQNNAFGSSALAQNTTGSENSAFGYLTMTSNTTGAYNTAFGNRALYSNTTANNNTAVGYQAGYSGTTSGDNTYIGKQAAYSATSQQNTIIGSGAGYGVVTSGGQVIIGYQAGYANVGTGSTLVGYQAGYSSTGSQNTFVGSYNGTNSCGYLMTTGSKNTIIGGYNGNQSGLDIRTASNYIVLSDGDGNPRAYWDSNGLPTLKSSSDTILTLTSSAGAYSSQIYLTYAGGGAGTIKSQGALYCNAGNQTTNGVYLPNGSSTAWLPVTSDERLKNKVSDIFNGLDAINKLKPLTYYYKNQPQIGIPNYGFFAQNVGDAIPDAKLVTPKKDEELGDVYTYDPSIINVYLVKAIQELSAKVTALEAQLGDK